MNLQKFSGNDSTGSAMRRNQAFLAAWILQENTMRATLKHRKICHFALLTALLVIPVINGIPNAVAQTANTGALSGVVTDPQKAVVPGAEIRVTNDATGETRTITSQPNGLYTVPLLPVGTYRISVTKQGFKEQIATNIHVNIAETGRLDFQLGVGPTTEVITVNAAAEVLQTQDQSLGRATTGEEIRSLPMVTRNFTQILALQPAVSTSVNNAGALGRGDSGMEVGDAGLSSHGAATSDNNFQLDGIEINDQNGSGGLSGGVPVPNPDTIQELRVQTGQYDATYGRNAGANVDLVTKTGTNAFHGTVFDFFRDTVLNANDFFRNSTHQPRAVLNQNQFGMTLGGPIKKDKLLFFTSYQGTRQKNGLANGVCSQSVTTPPGLTNDRSAATLGATFAGQSGLFGGSTVAADGSNINPAALALLNLKLPDGTFVVPTPQDPTTGLSTFSVPCIYNEDQFMTNGEYLQNEKSKFSGRFFFSNSDQSTTLPNANLGGATTPGFPLLEDNHFRVFSLTHTYDFSPTWVNQIVVGYHRVFSDSRQVEAFTFPQIGVSAPSYNQAFPAILVLGQFDLGGNGQSFTIAQNFYTFEDSVTYIRGRHLIRFGGGAERVQHNLPKLDFFGGLIFLSFPDMLLGQSAAQNGSPFSNVFESVDLPGLLSRAWRFWDGNAYVQDNFRLTSRFTVNFGARYEHIGVMGDALGRSSTFDINHADPNPPANGSVSGYIVGDNFKGTVPSGVQTADNSGAIQGNGRNVLEPRVGFAWQLPHTERLVLRGGYGIYYTRYDAEDTLSAGVTSPPFGILRTPSATTNAAATFQNPFATPPTLPQFLPYSPTTALTLSALAPNFRPPMLQNYSLNLQSKLAQDMVLELGYQGSRGTHLLDSRFENQALLASASSPVRGQTSNSLANVALRTPILGIAPGGDQVFETEGASWYNALTAGLTKQVRHGLQFQASYTFARMLDTSPNGATTSSLGGTVFGDQTSPRMDYGLDSSIRPHRFVFSYTYDLPGPANKLSGPGRILGGWAVSGVTVYQTGQPLFLTGENALSVFGIVPDLAQVSGNCAVNQLGTRGSVESKLTNYFNPVCFGVGATGSTTYAPFPGGGGATGFGNAPIGAVFGPRQSNTDIALIKRFALLPKRELPQAEFRTEFFNAFNHPQFSNPGTDFTSASFGQIRTTAVNARIIQMALKINF